MSRKQLLAVVLLVIVVIVGALYFTATKEPFKVYDSFSDYLDEKPRSPSDIERYTENLKAAYSADTFGGETPEETLELYKEALEAGDTDLAAKYFVLEKQERIARELAEGKKNGVLPLLIGDLERERVGTLNNDTFFSSAFDSSGGAELTYILVKNAYSNVWKIDSL